VSEFSLQEFESCKKIIGTSFEKDIELSGDFTLKRYGKWSKHTHSHPKEWSLSPSPGDLDAVDIFNNERGFDTEFELYSPLSGDYKEYNENTPSQVIEVIIEVNK